jgi:hypothetical protein
MAGISLQIAVQTSSITRLGTVLSPPLAVIMRSTTTVNGYSSELSRVWAFATLIDEYGEVVNDQLTGTLADSVHILPRGDDSEFYFLFGNLSIESTGTFRIRVTLMRMDTGSSGAASLQQIESNTIVVVDHAVEVQSASMVLFNESSSALLRLP